MNTGELVGENSDDMINLELIEKGEQSLHKVQIIAYTNCYLSATMLTVTFSSEGINGKLTQWHNLYCYFY